MSGYPSWPVQVIHTIHQMMGDRALNSTLCESSVLIFCGAQLLKLYLLQSGWYFMGEWDVLLLPIPKADFFCRLS